MLEDEISKDKMVEDEGNIDHERLGRLANL